MSIIFITGATGLIGRMYIKHFLNRGDSVIYTSTSKDKINVIANEYVAAVNENRLYGCCVDLVEDSYISVITEFLKLGSSENKLKMEKLEAENELLRAKAEKLQSEQRSEELFAEAIKAMSRYQGRCDDEDEDYDY